jgi:hypothetical protein
MVDLLERMSLLKHSTNTHLTVLSPQIDSAVRLALVPRLEHSTDSNGTLISATAIPDMAPVSYPAVVGNLSHSNEAPISVTTLRPSALNTIQDFLLRGERRQAYHFALDEKLWAHAMVISSSIDKDAWKEVVNEFLKSELGTSAAASVLMTQNSGSQTSANGRESLRVAYSLFSGQGAAAGKCFYLFQGHDLTFNSPRIDTPKYPIQDNYTLTAADYASYDSKDTKLRSTILGNRYSS